MTVLSDFEILDAIGSQYLVISPFTQENIQPVSIDLTLGERIKRHYPDLHGEIQDVKMPQDVYLFEEEIKDSFILNPKEFILTYTRERIELPFNLMGRLDGKSSLGRLGLLIHITAGVVDPGFQGQLVLEMYNVSPIPIKLYAGMKICQISFNRLNKESEKPYGHIDLNSKYQNQTGVVESRYNKNYD